MGPDFHLAELVERQPASVDAEPFDIGVVR